MIAIQADVRIQEGSPTVAEPSMSDTQVMEALRDGDDEAIAILVERFQRELVGFFYHHCWDQLVAEDLAQTVFIKLYKARARYKATAKLRTYLYRIARNAWIDHLRRQKPTISLDAQVGTGGATLGDLMEATYDHDKERRSAVIRQRIQDAVEELPEGQRDVFVLANNQEMKYDQISQVLDIPVGTVKSRMHAAVRNLRGKLGDLLEDAA